MYKNIMCIVHTQRQRPDHDLRYCSLVHVVLNILSITMQPAFVKTIYPVNNLRFHLVAGIVHECVCVYVCMYQRCVCVSVCECVYMCVCV